MIHIAAPIPASAAFNPTDEQYGPDWVLHQHLWERTLESLKQAAALEDAKLKELKKYYIDLAQANFFEPHIDSSNQHKIEIDKDHVRVHFKDGNVLHHSHQGLHLGENQKVTAEVAKVVMQVALTEWGGKCTINPGLSKKEQLVLMQAAHAAGVTVTNANLSTPSMDLSGIVPTPPNPPVPPSQPTPTEDLPKNPMDLGADSSDLAAYLTAVKKENKRKNQTLKAALHHEKIIGALVGRMLQADHINELVEDYRKGKLFDAETGAAYKGIGVKLYSKGAGPQEKAQRIAELAARSPEVARQVAGHYTRLMAQFDKDLALADRIATDATRATLTREVITWLVERNDRFFRVLTAPPDVPNVREREMTRGPSTEQVEAEKQRVRSEAEKAQRDKAEAEAKQRQEGDARQQQIIETQQRDWLNREASECDTGRPNGRSRGGRSRGMER